MRPPRPLWWSVPILVLLAAVAVAREPADKTEIRTLLISEHPSELRSNIYVSGQVVTVLRFEQDCDPAGTKLLDGESRFEPLLVGGKKVVLEPFRDLDDGEWAPLVVTLYDSLQRERELREENERFKKEENSADHAFATLLANGHLDKTPFRRKQTALLKNADMDIKVDVFSGPGKAAVVVYLTNTYNDEPWRFRDARLTSDLNASTVRPFALRMERAELVRGQSGRIAVVADRSAFESKEGLVDLTLEIFREDGLQQVVVLVDHALIRQ